MTKIPGRLAYAAAVSIAAIALAAASPARSTPVILGVAPPAPERSDAMQILTITGRDFQPSLTLGVFSPDGATTEVRGSEIRARTPTSFQVSLRLAVDGAYTLTVTNTDGGISAPYVLKVGKPAPSTAPAIARVVPAEVTRGYETQEVVVEGQRFSADLRAILTDPIGEDVFDKELSSIEPATFRLRARFDKAGAYELSVSNASGEVSNVVQIVVRYALEFPLPWTEEVSRYAFVWASFLAAAPIVGRNEHFMIDMLVESLSGNAKRLCLILAAICTLATACARNIADFRLTAEARSNPDSVTSTIRSSICVPTSQTGFSDDVGCWKIMLIRSPRMCRIWSSDRVSRSWPSKMIWPASMRPGRATRRRMLRLVTLLPQPDSPTRPMISPRSTTKSMPSTALTTPSRV